MENDAGGVVLLNSRGKIEILISCPQINPSISYEKYDYPGTVN